MTTPHRTLAEALLDSSSTAQYLIDRLASTDERWDVLASRSGCGVLMRLGQKYGARTVIEALGRLREEGRDDTREAIALLTSVCAAIERGRS